MGYDEAGPYSFSRATTIDELRQRVEDAWVNPSQDDIRHLYDCLPGIRGTLCIDVTVWASLTVTCVFQLVRICYHILLQ